MERRNGCIYIKVPSWKIRIRKPNTKVKVKASSYYKTTDAMRETVDFVKNNISLFSLVFWMFVIFQFSNQTGTSSLETSNNVKNMFQQVPILSAVFHIIPIRKAAHMFLYFVLSLLSYWWISSNFQEVSRKHKIEFRKLVLLFSILLCFCYACLDETHQLFVQGRGAGFGDVLIDTLGALVGISFVTIVSYFRNLAVGNKYY